ncbi:MAG: nucleotidyltransferase family protein [bacterium]
MKRDKSKIYNEIISFLKERKARKIAVFGSYVRDEETADSDIDIIVEFNDRKSLLDFVGMERELSENIGVKVDLLTEQSISPNLIDRVREEMKIIYQ